MKRFQLDLYKNEIINMYIEKHYTCNKIAQELDCSLCGVYDALKRWGIKTRNLSQSHRKKKYDEMFFNTIDSEEKAYWLGFIYADGYITKGNNLGIALSNKDIGHLYKFIKSIDGNFEPKTYIGTGYTNNPYSRVMLKSENIINGVINNGVKYNKSLILEFPNQTQVPTELINHFIRGYFDGDGSIILSKNSINMKICGTKEFLHGIIYTLNENCTYEYKKVLYKRRKDDKNTYYISFGGRLKVLDALNFIYKDSTIYLDRKYSRYKILLH